MVRKEVENSTNFSKPKPDALNISGRNVQNIGFVAI